MPRDKEFDPQAALHSAMLLFWQKGYLDTSYDDLVQATGVSRYGLYSAFGDKYQLFLKAMDHYSNTNIEFMLSPLETPDASIPEIQGYFNRLIGGLTSPQGSAGCLIGNSSMEIAAPEEALLTRITHHFDRMRAAFRNALQNALRRAEIAPDVDIDAYSDYLVGVAMGYLGCVHAKMEADRVTHFVETALANLP